MIAWQVSRHHVAIAGRVTDGETGKRVGRVEVTITEMPPAFKRKLEGASMQYGNRWTAMVERPDKTLTRADGLFYFLDLPDGKYTLGASLPSSGKRYGTAQETATVSRDAKGNIKMASVNVILRPTTIKGRITGPAHKNGVVMAEVRVKGSGERAFSDEQGHYVLAGLEPGKRTVLAFAQGYRPASEAVELREPGASHTLNLVLVREAG
jgi:hypothetical protein